MRTYKTSKASFAKIRRDLIIRLGLIFTLIFGGIIGWEIWQNRSNGEGDLYSLILIAAVLIFTGIFGIGKAIAQQQEIWNSIEINLDSDYISRQQVRVPEVKIYRSEIATVESDKAGIWVKADDKARTIVIPAQLDRADYLEIKETLTNWQGEEIAAVKRNKEMAIAIAYIVAFLILFLSFNIWLNFILGIGIIIYNIYTNKLIQNNVSIDPQFKKTYKRNLAITTFLVLINTFGKIYLLSAIKRIKQEVNKNPQALIFKTDYRSSDRNY